MGVSFSDAESFCQWRFSRSGGGGRLPSPQELASLNPQPPLPPLPPCAQSTQAQWLEWTGPSFPSPIDSAPTAPLFLHSSSQPPSQSTSTHRQLDIDLSSSFLTFRCARTIPPDLIND